MGWQKALGFGIVVAAGCAAPPPAPSAPPVAVSPRPAAPPVAPAASPAAPPVVALLEPFLVSVSARRLEAAPNPLGGRIVPIEPESPLVPAPPTQTRPLSPPPAAKSGPAPVAPRARTVSPALVRLFEEERAHAVEVAKSNVATAAARVGQTSADAKKTWELVRAGALAQFKADQADAAVRAATSEKADADRVLDEAQERRRNARRDIEAALAATASRPSEGVLVQREVALPSFRPVPYTYRLSILGASQPDVKVEGGTLGRPLAPGKGEGNAWIVRCLDVSKLRVRFGKGEAVVVPRSLPNPKSAPPRA